MSKQTLEKLLSGADPVKESNDGTDIESLLKTYFTGSIKDQFLSDFNSAVGTEGPSIRSMCRRWNTLELLIGWAIRIQSDVGHNVLQEVGLTNEEANQLINLMGIFRSKLGSFNATAKPNTPTKMLYDQVIRIGF